MQYPLTSILKIQKVYKGYKARKVYQSILAEKILKEEEERFENERKKIEEGMKELDTFASRDRWEYEDMCLSTDRRPIIVSNSSTKKLSSAKKENNPPDLSLSKIQKKMNFSYIADDRYSSKTSRDRNGSPKLLSSRSEMTSCTTRRTREHDNDNLPYFCIVSQSKPANKLSSTKKNKKPIMFEFDIFAATDIQKVWRGFYFRKKNSTIRKIVRAVKIIQKRYRKYRAEKIKQVKEKLKMVHIQQKKITKYLEGYEVCFEKLKKSYPHSKVQNILKNSKTQLLETLQSLLKKKSNQEYIAPKKEISTQTQNFSQSITTASCSYAAGSFINERKLPNKVQRSLNFHEGLSHNDSSWFIDNQKSEFLLPNNFETTCCCPKDEIISELKKDLERMREKYYEQENRHAQEVKTLKSKLKKAKDSYNDYTEKVLKIVYDESKGFGSKGRDSKDMIRSLNSKYTSAFHDNERILTDMSNFDEECSDFGLYTFNR